jgi:hypothetical protein
VVDAVVDVDVVVDRAIRQHYQQKNEFMTKQISRTNCINFLKLFLQHDQNEVKTCC